jgi:hypothetical protein
MGTESSTGGRFIDVVMREMERVLRAFAAGKAGWRVTRTSAVTMTLSGPHGEEHSFLVGLANAWDPAQEAMDLVGIHVACGSTGASANAEYPYSLLVRGIVGTLLEIGAVGGQEDVAERVTAILEPYLA